MLSIKNNIGSLPEGAYVWKKCERTVVYESYTENFYDRYVDASITSYPITVYTSSGYTFDETTRLYTLTEPVAETTLTSTKAIDVYNNFVTVNSPSSKQMFHSDNDVYGARQTYFSVETLGLRVYTTVSNNILILYDSTENITNTFVDFTVSDDPTAYPNGGEKGGYWYELYGMPIKIVTWAGGTDEEIVAMVEAADQGLINLSDYWAVGDTRTVQLSAMSATGVGESHAAQQVDLVLMHAGGYNLNAAVASGRTKCSFVVGLKDSLTEAGYMNSSNTNSGSWNGSARRTWCNNVFRNAIPSTLRAIFKQFKTVTAQTYNGSTNQTSVDYFALPAEREIFDARNYCNQTEYNALFQFDYYKTASNRVKKLGKTGTADYWWERSPSRNYNHAFCAVGSSGDTNVNDANAAYGLAPFGCI